jgi:hypothetical protein
MKANYSRDIIYIRDNSSSRTVGISRKASNRIETSSMQQLHEMPDAR